MLISSVAQEVGHKFPSMLLQSIDITNCVENEHAHLKQDLILSGNAKHEVSISNIHKTGLLNSPIGSQIFN